ncbi:domain iii family protein [Stylonychia lemnae]|uniref:Domain iii family protein n=1 Tax=Stylonychia lemnae TaxID=5949 RepID=A0A078AWV1_STYLE|nr:domain iii family protein [Stylonychia lemnae]|eukprot:CDW86644.1 domain iii family protein [Stylonychia lemnae]
MQYRQKLVPLLQDMFQRFYQYRNVWNNAVHCMAELDALCSLAVISHEPHMVRPVVHSKNEKPFLNVKQMRHPCVMHQKKQFVPNDVVLEYDNQRALLITGPNMGGKSTLLRATCLITILAQIGCHVPAESCELTIVDQIYTRIGASDRILENLSTFKLELSETKSIVDNANKHSLVIMDELG